MDVLHLIAQALHAPIVQGLVDGIHNAGVEGLPLPKNFVQGVSPAQTP